jgi:hypothetical protein
MPESYHSSIHEEAPMRKPVEIDGTRPLEPPKARESHFGIIVTLASFVAAASTCSAVVGLALAG